MKAFFMSVIVLVDVSDIFIRAEEAALGLRVLGADIDYQALWSHWSVSTGGGRLGWFAEELLWLGATERDGPGGLNERVVDRWGSSCFFND